MMYTEFLDKYGLRQEDCPYSDYNDIELFYTYSDSFNSQEDFFEYAKLMDFHTLLKTAKIYVADVARLIRDKNDKEEKAAEERRKRAELESKLAYMQDFISRNRTAIEENIIAVRIQTAEASAKAEVEEMLSI